MIFETIIVFVFMLCYNDVSSVTVEVNEGVLQGQTLVSATGRKYYSFKGIRYAQPPVGKLRFRPPQPPENFEGIRNATEHGSVCLQYRDGPDSDIIGNEDCLFLNVYTPVINSDERLLPVMLFIHGGSFASGSGNDNNYDPRFLMDYEVVLVTINYRLDVMGFLSVNNEKASGNAGLKDQIAAMKWVQRNIRRFGGDSKRVTIFGQSAGSASVSLHLIVPAARGLFHRAICMSGVFSLHFATQYESEQRAFALGRLLGLETNNSTLLVRFLLEQSAEKLLLKRPVIFLSDEPQVELLTKTYFAPTIETKFGNCSDQYLTQTPLSLMRSYRVNHADLLIGHTALEGLRNAYLATELFLKYYPKYKELLVPPRISYYRSPQTVLKLGERIKEFYFGNQPISLQTIKQLATAYTYFHYVYDIHAYIENLRKLPGTRRYFYGFEILSERNVYSIPATEKFGIKKATHTDDRPYIFAGIGYNLTDDQGFQYVELMCTLFTNFAKFGTPTPDNSLGFIWPQYDPDRNFVLIGENGDLSSSRVSYSSNTSIGFWYRLYKSVGIVI